MDGAFAVWNLLYFTVLGVVIMLLLADSRFSAGRTAAIGCAALAVLLPAEVAVYRHMGLLALVDLYTPLVHLPLLVLFIWLSRQRNWQMVFQLLSAILFCFLIHQGASLCWLLSGGRLWAMAAGYAVLSAAVIVFLLKYLRPMARRIFGRVRGGWWLMCLLLAGYYAINIYLIPGLAGESATATLIKSAVSLLMAGVYVVFLYLLGSLYRETEARYSARLYAANLAAVKNQLETAAAAEEADRVARHDLRHRLRAVAELARRGDHAAILALVEREEQRLAEAAPERWCVPPVLNAVFSYYFGEARRLGVAVEADICLPQPLPAEEEELAMVFSNALENAVEANRALPSEERALRCRVIARPRLMLEIANPCAEAVPFDETGLPLSRREGHGWGVRSIAAFCQKYSALCRYEQKEGWFILRVIL